MPQWMMDEADEHFWLGQDLESSRALEYGVPTPNVQMEEVGQQVMWRPAMNLVPEGPPLVPLMEVPNEESGATQVQEDCTMVDDAAMA